jgi:nitrite reductase (NADH) small subunit
MTATHASAGKWIRVCTLDDIPVLGARVIERDNGDDIALFRPAVDRVFALADRCPHKGGPLSQGIVAGDTVTCPLHGWNIELDSGNACAPDVGCARGFPVRVVDAAVWLPLNVFEASTTEHAASSEQLA